MNFASGQLVGFLWPWKQTLFWNCLSCHTSELKRIWQTLQEMIGRFVFIIGGPKVCVITAFWTGSIWGETAQRSHQKFSTTGEIQRPVLLLTAVHSKVQPSECGWEREREALKKKCRWMTASEGEERLGDKIELGKREVKREQWLMWTGRCVFSLQQLVLLSVPEFLGAVQTL